LIELKEFQKQAADQIAERFAKYYESPPMRGRQNDLRVVPFYQSLASITASGKTVILADAISTMSAMLPLAPVVLWLSKGKVVVDQTASNLAPGGKYNHLLGNANFSYLAEYDPLDVRTSTAPLVFFATVGTFNQKDREKGERLIFKSRLIRRTTARGTLSRHAPMRTTIVDRCSLSTTRDTISPISRWSFCSSSNRTR
jgi:type III restriction enzyme